MLSLFGLGDEVDHKVSVGALTVILQRAIEEVCARYQYLTAELAYEDSFLVGQVLFDMCNSAFNEEIVDGSVNSWRADVTHAVVCQLKAMRDRPAADSRMTHCYWRHSFAGSLRSFPILERRMTYDLVAAYAAFATRLEAWLNSDECTAGWVGVCVLRVVHRQIHEAARRFAQMEPELQQDG